MKKISRPLLFSGIIISLAAYIALLVSSAILIIPAIMLISSAGEGMDEGAAESIVNMFGDMMGMVLMYTSIILIILSLIGVLCAAFSFSKVNLSPSEFENKKKTVRRLITYTIITIVVGIICLVSSFSVVNLLVILALVAACVLMFIDWFKNKKLLKAEAQSAAQTQPQAEQAKPAEEQPKVEEAKVEEKAEEPKKAKKSSKAKAKEKEEVKQEEPAVEEKPSDKSE